MLLKIIYLLIYFIFLLLFSLIRLFIFQLIFYRLINLVNLTFLMIKNIRSIFIILEHFLTIIFSIVLISSIPKFHL